MTVEFNLLKNHEGLLREIKNGMINDGITPLFISYDGIEVSVSYNNNNFQFIATGSRLDPEVKREIEYLFNNED